MNSSFHLISLIKCLKDRTVPELVTWHKQAKVAWDKNSLLCFISARIIIFIIVIINFIDIIITMIFCCLSGFIKAKMLTDDVPTNKIKLESLFLSFSGASLIIVIYLIAYHFYTLWFVARSFASKINYFKLILEKDSPEKI